MLTDRFGKIWTTKLTKRSRDAIRDWTLKQQVFATPYVPGQPLPELVWKDVPLSIRVSDLGELQMLQTDQDTLWEVIAAWLFPQWQHFVLVVDKGLPSEETLNGRSAFDEVCDAGFLAAALVALEQHALLFSSGPWGQMRVQEYEKVKAEQIEVERRKLQKDWNTNSNPAGRNTAESSSSVPTPPTSVGGNSNSGIAGSAATSTPTIVS